MINLDTLPCPVCGQIGSGILHTTTYPEQRYPGVFTMRRCSTCGLLFNSPRLDDEGLGKLYGGNYYFFLRSDAREFGRIVGMHQRTVGLLEDPVGGRRVVDIGCGRGFFPAVLKELGWEASGVELSSEASAYAREKFGLDVFTGTVEQFAKSDRRRGFPLVTAIDVIEHVPDPDAFISASASIVERGGRLIIDTPNARARNIELKGVAWKGFNPFHIYLFSIENLAALLKRHGMEVERSFSYGNVSSPRTARDAAIGAVKAMGLGGIAASAYFGLKKLSIRQGDPRELIRTASAEIRSSPAYAKTPDAGGELAGDKSGDNIVVVARKA